MKYGDKFYIKRYSTEICHVYSFRIDPIRGSGKKHFKCFKNPMTTQERKLFFKYKPYVRGKRTYKSLPSAWDDIFKSHKKGWKSSKKKKQWM